MANVPVELSYSRPAPATSAGLSARRLLIPREHGSWGLWLLPLISGAGLGWSKRSDGSVVAITWFFVAAASAFLVHQPFQVWLRHSVLKARSAEEERFAMAATFILLAVSGLSLVALLLQGRPSIVLVVVLAGGCFFATLLMAGPGKRWLRPSAQIVGALGLTSTSLGAYYAVTGTIDTRAALLWLGSWLFAAAQIAYVQLRMCTASATSRKQKLRAGWKVGLLHLALPLAAVVAAISGVVSWILALAFVPAAARLVFWTICPPARIRVHRLGFTELAQNVIFAALLVAALLPR